MYLVCQIHKNILGETTRFAQWETAVRYAAEIASKDDDITFDRAYDELDSDGSYLSTDKEWALCITDIS